VVPGIVVPDETAPPFTAVVEALGINRAIEVPPGVSEWFAERGPVPVLGLLDDVGVRGTLVPTGAGRHRLFLNAEMREALGVGVGDFLEVVLWRDPEPRDPELPDDLRLALERAGALEAFLTWPPSHRREYVVAIDEAKRPETRRRRIDRTVAATLDRQARR